MKQKSNLSEFFLKEFVKELIMNSIPEGMPLQVRQEIPDFEEPEIEPQKQITPFSKPMRDLDLQPEYKKSEITRPLNQIPISSLPPMETKPKEKQFSQEEMRASLKPSKKTEIFQAQRAGKPLVRPTPGNPDLGKLNTLGADVRVESIECTGPNKNILVKKDGTIQRTNIILTKEEIEKILEDFSEQTRIPLVGGMFKAALGNLIMTAVVSEFVGGRFVIQKKNPFQNNETLPLS